MVRKDCWIQLIVGLIRLSLVDMGQRSPIYRLWLWRGKWRCRGLSLWDIGQRAHLGQQRQSWQAQEYGRKQKPTTHQSSAKE
jgi:hypothetical protein